jgi:hypothetical protein
MSEEVKFDIGDKAEELLFSVFDLTTSRQHYPVKFRRLADQLQTYALNIHSNVMDANSFRTDSSSQRQKRFDFQTSAVTNCNKFLSLVKYSLHAHLISAATGESWSALAHDVKYMTLAWRKT